MDQEQIFAKGRRFLDWSIESSRNLRNVVLVLLGLWLLGVLLAFVVPTWVTSRAIANANSGVVAAEQMYEDTQERYEAVIVWFAQGYAADVPGFIESGKTTIDQASNLLEEAKASRNPDKKLQLVNQAEDLLLDSDDEFARANGTIDGILLNRTLARVALEQLEESLPSQADYEQLQDRLDAATTVQLEEYTDPLTALLELLERNADEINTYRQQASVLLPSDDSIEGIGDPNRAVQLVNVAETLLDTSSNIAFQVSQELDYLDEAYENAFDTAQSASHRCRESNASIRAIHGQGYWLVGPSETLGTGTGFADNAIAASTTQVEGTYDYPGIYKLGTDALYFCTKAQNDAEAEVRTAQEVWQLIASFDGAYAVASSEVQTMQSAVQILQAYHAYEVWNSIGPNIERAQVGLDNATVQILYAGDLASMDRQEFYTALAEAESAYRFLQEAESESLLVVTFTENRERIRVQWPQVRDSATNTINAQTAYILAHGSYSSSARGDYYDAVDLLANAESEAANRRYESATQLANQAKSLADGTGQRALRAHNAEISAQAAEEAARRRREEQQQQSQSTWSYDPWESSGGGLSDPYNSGDIFDSGGSSTGSYDYGSDFGSDSYSDFGSDSYSDFGSDSDW